ncbi:FAD-dependent oxidoreductase [Dapis sp. BLCC M229]|uniref:FAD-dependent oxidoreductase n=1 Tax=Dapis sp. BLCC M229 TaxID=3400188 RepID=UPI003CF3BAA1
MKPENSNPKIDYDVAIVGAGPVGLATALGLRQRGIENIIVLDQTRAFRRVGQNIIVAPNGLKALKYLDIQAYENMKETFHKSNNLLQKDRPKPKWTVRNVDGEKISLFFLGYDEIIQKYGDFVTFMHWYDLQSKLRTLLPSYLVKANHRCVNVVGEPEFKCVRADFVSNLGAKPNPYSHWENKQEKDKNSTGSSSQFLESEITSIRAKLLIAADGINSTVRQIIYKETPYSAYSKPEYSGFSGICCDEVNELPEALLQQIESRFFNGASGVVIYNDSNWENSAENQISKMKMVIWSQAPGQFKYIIDAGLALELLAGKSGKELIDTIVLELKKANFPEMIQQFVALSSPEQTVQRPFYIHPVTVNTQDKLKWNMGRVVLVGDAAHGMPPLAGQGANQGFEDAAAIATLIGEINKQNQWDDMKAIEAAFNKYQSLRCPILERVQQVSLSIIPLSEGEQREYAEKLYGRNIP